MIWENAQDVKFNERRRNQDLIFLNSSKKSNFNSCLSFHYMDFPYIHVCELLAQLVKNPPAMQETPVQFLGWEDPLEKV